MLAHRLRRWPNIETALGESPVFAGLNQCCYNTSRVARSALVERLTVTSITEASRVRTTLRVFQKNGPINSIGQWAKTTHRESPPPPPHHTHTNFLICLRHEMLTAKK